MLALAGRQTVVTETDVRPVSVSLRSSELSNPNGQCFKTSNFKHSNCGRDVKLGSRMEDGIERSFFSWLFLVFDCSAGMWMCLGSWKKDDEESL